MTLATMPTPVLPAFLPLGSDTLSAPDQKRARRIARKVADLCVLAAQTRFRRVHGHDVDRTNATDVGRYNALIWSLHKMAPGWWASTAPYVSLRGRMLVMDDYARTWADTRLNPA